MFFRRVIVMLLVAAVAFALAACQSAGSQEPAASAAETIPAVTQETPTAEPAVEEGSLTLRMAIADTSGRASEPFILEFIDQVDALSDGQITVEPVWDAGAKTEQREEHGVLVAVLDGDYDLGLVASRIFEHEGITSFQPLQTPFLIDNDDLAVAVAESDMATQMLDALPASGLVGLTLWPEDLRHIFSIVPGEPVLSPADLAGQTVRTTSEGVTSALVETLGGTPELYASNYDRTEAGLLQGYSLTGRPIATGNVTFFSKFQVLFGNGDAFDRLTAEQQAVLREAAAAVQAKALAEHPGDAAAGEAWCADGGTIVLAGDEQLAAFKDAAQPVVEMIEADPANAKIVAALRDLKDSVQPSAGAGACGEVGVAAAASNSDEESWSPGLPPNGVWQVDLTLDDIIGMGVLESNAPGWAGMNSYEFNDGQGMFRGEFLDGVLIVCPYTYEVVDDFFRLTYVDKGLDNYECGDQVDDLQWRLDDDGLHLHLVDIQDGLLLENTALYEPQPWQLVEVWSEGLPPDGVYKVEMTADDFEEAGVLRSVAESDWAGTYTYTFAGGESQFEWQGSSMSAGCQATYEVVEDFVRFTYYSDANECEGQVDDVQWRLDEDGLHWNVIAIQNAPASEIAAIYEARPWQQVEKLSEEQSPGGGAQAELKDSFAGNSNWIAYQTDRTGGEGVWLIRPAGTEDHQIAADAPFDILLPDWSPDGTKLVVASRGGENEQLYIYDLQTETLSLPFQCVDFEPGCFADEPDWSPDGSKIAFINYGGGFAYSESAGGEVPIECDLTIGDLETGELTTVTENRDDCQREYLARWSPDGTQFVYTSDPYENGRPTGTSVFIINADGTGKRQLTDPEMVTGEADWTADGQWIVFATYPLFEYGRSSEPSNLYRIHPDGSGLEQLTFFETTDLRATQPRPTPDGKWILFTADTPGGRSLWAMPGSGGEPFEVAKGGIYTHAVMQPSGS